MTFLKDQLPDSFVTLVITSLFRLTCYLHGNGEKVLGKRSTLQLFKPTKHLKKILNI